MSEFVQKVLSHLVETFLQYYAQNFFDILGHEKKGLSQKPARIGMITARQRVGIRVGTKKEIAQHLAFF